jgi:hypothetical protein
VAVNCDHEVRFKLAAITCSWLAYNPDSAAECERSLLCTAEYIKWSQSGLRVVANTGVVWSPRDQCMEAQECMKRYL